MRINTMTGALATGILAAVALSAPAAGAAAPTAETAKADVLDVVRHFTRPIHPQALAVAGTGSKVDAAAWQVCGSSAVAGIGGVLDTDPDIIFGNCANANAVLSQDTTNPVVGVLNDSAVIAAPWQVCGSDAVGGIGGVISARAPKTVIGDCSNANVKINVRHDHGYGRHRDPQGRTADASTRSAHSSWHGVREPQGLISVLSGSSILVAPWQVCGSTAVAGVGGALAAQSPHTVWGDCNNGNVHIRQSDPSALVSVLDNSSISVASWQVCGSNAVAGVGGTASVGSPNVVVGDCNNSNTVID